MEQITLIFAIVAVVFLFTLLLLVLSRYRKCPSDKVLIIYGKVGSNPDGSPRSAKCIHGGAAFIWPIFQSFQYLELTPMTINVDLTNALSQQNIRVDVPSRFTVGISTETGVMQNAAERLLGLRTAEIQELARDILFGQLRLVIATMAIEEINTDRDKFLEAVSHNVETELKKIGLRLINVNVTDITDESGYIEALGKEAAAKAINDAKQSVAEKNRDGSIGASKALSTQRIQVAESDASAVEGENRSKALISQSDATRREQEAEALRRATAAERTAEARALEEAYAAQQAAEKARAERDEATGQADIIVKARIAKERLELEAEADAEQARRRAKGEADAIYARMEAQARGMQEVLEKQAAGFGKVVEAAGGDTTAAIQLMLADKIEELVKIQVEAIKNLQIDKITVWDSMSGDGGSPTTSNFLSGMMRSIPPLNEMFKMAGMSIPGFLGTELVNAQETCDPEVTMSAATQADAQAKLAENSTNSAEEMQS
ncbi:MAG: SPFH domain-containing protein [Oscillospiraceae bacterium]|nr:SPFH domain-containing protein [Oscillospiraceae bacterium]